MRETFIDILDRIEAEWPFFNKRALSIDNLLCWAEALDLVVISTHLVKKAALQPLLGKIHLLYNDNLPTGEQAFAVAHEIAHYLLGHQEDRASHEWQADVVACRAILPTPVLAQIYEAKQGLTPEMIHWYFAPWDMSDQASWEFCEMRARVFMEFAEAIEEVA